jgi:hypothetical protein
LYLDNKETGYSNEVSVANYDRYSEGTIAIERVHTKRATER